MAVHHDILTKEMMEIGPCHSVSLLSSSVSPFPLTTEQNSFQTCNISTCLLCFNLAVVGWRWGVWNEVRGGEGQSKLIDLIDLSKLNLRVRMKSSVPVVYKELYLIPGETFNNLKVGLTLVLIELS